MSIHLIKSSSGEQSDEFGKNGIEWEDFTWRNCRMVYAESDLLTIVMKIIFLEQELYNLVR